MEFSDLHLHLSDQLVSGRRRQLRVYDFFDGRDFDKHYNHIFLY